MVESSDSTHPYSQVSQEPPPEVPQFPIGPLEAQGAKLGIVISVQPISSQPPPENSPWTTSEDSESESPEMST